MNQQPHDSPRIAPFGTWRSPITPERVAECPLGLKDLVTDGGSVYWIGTPSATDTRRAVFQWDADLGIRERVPNPFSVRTAVHEYGGGAFLVLGDAVVFSNSGDQRLYRAIEGAAPSPLTPAGPYRYADGSADSRRNRIVCVRETHGPGEPVINDLITVSADGKGDPRSLVGGSDFYSTPRVSPDGRQLAWLSWNHPSMPWTGTELWLARLDDEGGVTEPRQIAGGTTESVFQPEWSPDGILHFISDRTGWWNLYRLENGRIRALAPREADFGQPQWEFRLSNYAFASSDVLVCAYMSGGMARLARLDLTSGNLEDLASPFTEVIQLSALPGRVAVLGGSPTEPFSIAVVDPASGRTEILRRSFESADIAPWFSTPLSVEYQSEGNRRAHAFFYAPANPEFAALAGELPPLLIHCHGGPAYAASTALDLRVQCWTSRGFAVMLLNYTGSTGYGREYRQALEGKWGIADLADIAAAVRYAGERGLADRHRAVISGQSAGGYLTLCALAFSDIFRAGASYYGVSDVELLRRGTHKFESSYVERLVGAPPENAAEYRSRSPLFAADNISAPVLFFQGEDDPIAPSAQASILMAALRKRGALASGLFFSAEEHGFQKSETIRRTLDAEMYLYALVLLNGPLRF